MRLVKVKCELCGTELEAACLSELQSKQSRHKCVRVNKRVARTQALQQGLLNSFLADTAVNGIEEHNFNKIIHRGLIV